MCYLNLKNSLKDDPREEKNSPSDLNVVELCCLKLKEVAGDKHGPMLSIH